MKVNIAITLTLIAISLLNGEFASTRQDNNISSRTLSTPDYSTYLGGSGNDGGGIATSDKHGGLYIVGASKSFDFPFTEDAIQPYWAGDYDIYITRLTKDGDRITYSTLFGGSSRDTPCGTYLDSDNNLIIAGTTYSFDFPLTANAIEKRFNGSAMGFVSKLDSTGQLIFSTYIGGEEHDQLFGMAVDDEGNIYVTGLTESQQLPVTPGALQSTFRGGSNDSFVMKIDSAGSRILYCTYFGASGYDEAYTIEVNKKGEAIIAGTTNSQNLPTTPGVVFGEAPWGGEDGFIVKLSADGQRLVQSTYLGAVEGWDYIKSIDIDNDENIYALGYTRSSDFPVTLGVIRPYLSNPGTKRGDWCGFVTKLSPQMDSLYFSTYLGGNYVEWPQKIYSYREKVVVIGSTQSHDFPVTAYAVQSTLKGTEDVFLTILNHDATKILYSTYYGGTGYEAGAGVILDYDSSILIGLNTQSLDFPTTPNALQPQFGGGTSDAGLVKFSINDIITSAASPPQTPTTLTLLQSYPNPVAGSGMVTIPYTTAARGSGTVAIYNSTGQEVYSRKVSHNTAGQYTLTAMLPGLPKGLYFYTLEYNGAHLTRKLIIE